MMSFKKENLPGILAGSTLLLVSIGFLLLWWAYPFNSSTASLLWSTFSLPFILVPTWIICVRRMATVEVAPRILVLVVAGLFSIFDVMSIAPVTLVTNVLTIGSFCMCLYKWKEPSGKRLENLKLFGVLVAPILIFVGLFCVPILHRPFDSVLWVKDARCRFSMYDDLQTRIGLEGRDKNYIIGVLGTADKSFDGSNSLAYNLTPGTRDSEARLEIDFSDNKVTHHELIRDP